MTVFVKRAAGGAIEALYPDLELGVAEEALADDAAEVVAFRALTLYRARRAVAYRDRLGKEAGDFIRTLGDVLDVLIAELRARGAAATPGFTALCDAIDAIKVEIPPPA